MNWEYLFEYRVAYGIAEIAIALDEKPATVAQWHRRGKLGWGPPNATLKCGPVWFGKQILDATESGCGIECWLAHRIEHHFGLTKEECWDEYDNMFVPLEEWNPAAKAAMDAHFSAEENGYLSPLILGLASAAARAQAKGVTERAWRASVLEENGDSPTLTKAIRQIKTWMREDRLWPWDAE